MADMTNLFPNKAQFDTLNSLLAIIASKTGEAGVESWEAVRQAVRSGGAPTLFPVGAQLVCERTTAEGTPERIVWDVVAHDYNVAAHGQYQHSMTLLTHDCVVNSMEYDGAEALYYCESGLAAGTYHFMLLPGYDTAHGGGKTYQFTLAKPVPAKGVITFPWDYGAQAADTKISTYASSADAAAIEQVSVTLGSSGVNLGIADGTTPNMNNTHRIRYGSNNWKESAMRQFLNSAAPAGQVWKPQTKFDRQPPWATSKAGWIAGLDPDFLAVVGLARIKNLTNSLYEVDGNVSGSYSTDDRFWLPSKSEVCGISADGISDGTRLPYYSGAANADRVKYNASGAARIWWLRSPNPIGPASIQVIDATGVLNDNLAMNSNGVAVACAIF